MYNPNEIFVTTTSSLEGMKIVKYIEPISSHLVAGTNIFKDVFASFSDVFGGRSETYQKQISGLYKEAIENLKRVAYDKNANCVLGLQIDVDEISGGGKSMFMITAIGTAVIAIDTQSGNLNTLLNYEDQNATIENINNERRKNEIVNLSKDETLVLNDENWEFITNYQVAEVYDYVISNLYKSYLDVGSITSLDQLYNTSVYLRTLNYLSRLPQTLKKDRLYNSLFTAEKITYANIISKIIGDLNLLDLDIVIQNLRKSDFIYQKRAVGLLKYDKHNYKKEDIDKILIINELIKNNFNERTKKINKKSLLGSKEVVICECGSNDFYPNGYCIKCNKDFYGFHGTEFNPGNASDKIQELIPILNNIIK